MLKNYVTILSVFLVLKFNAQNVGISAGSFTPNQMLHIHGASNEGIKVSNPTSGNGSNDGADFLVDGLKLNLIQNENAPIGLFTNGLERFSILGNGNIGIGSTSPAYLLDVSGTLHCDLLDINGAYNLPSVAGSSTEFLRGDGTWRSVPSLYSGSGSLSGATVVTYGGNNLINDLTGSGEFRIQKDAQNVTNQEALMIDYNSSGILSTNRVHRAALFDMDANNVTNSSGNFNLYGHELQINTGGSTNSNNARGYITNYTNTSTGTQSNVYGNYNYLRNNSSGNINNVYGSYSWIRKDNTGSNNNSYGFYSRMDRNSGTSGNAYCFYGSMEGIHTNEWGIYITGENENYLSGNLWLGTTSSTYKLDVAGTAHVDQLNVNGAYDLPTSVGTTSQYLRGDGTWQTIPSGTDDQNLSVGAGTPTTSVIEMENGNNITLIEGSNIQLTENTTNGEITIEATGDGTGTDDQNITGSTLIGTNLTIGIENGSSQIVDMSGLQDGNGIYSGNGSLSGNTTVTQGASNLIYNLNNSGDFQVRDNNTALFSVSNLGGIGIKTHSPTRELDVNGDVRLRGRIFDENNQAGSTGEVLTRTGTGVDWQAPPAGSDDQNLSVGAGTATTSVIEMEDGNDITLIEGPNIQLTENTTNGEITIEAIGDGTGTDNQNLSVGAGTASTSIIEMENGNDITLIEGPNIQLTENTTNGEITIEAIGDGTGTDNQNLSVGTGTPTTSVIEVENGDDITLIAGTNVSLSENTTNREITINSSGADNLGNHTATTDLDMGNNDIQLGLNSNITIAGAPGNNGWRLTTDGTSVYWGAPTGFDGNGIYSGSGTLTSTSHVTCSGGSLTFGTSGSVGVRIGASGIVAGSVAGLSTAPISIADVGNAVLEIDASGAGTTFDARIELSNDGTPEWTLGFDDSDGDKFKIGQATINNNTALTINSSGNMGIGTTNPSEKLEVSGIVKSQGVEAGSMRINRQAVASIIYTITSSDYYIGLTSTSVAFVTVNLPAAAAIGSGQVFIIKDEAGGAGAFNVTIDGNGTETIDGALTKSISTNYGVVKLICDGNNWFTTL